LFYKNLDYLAALHKVGYTVFDVPIMKLNWVNRNKFCEIKDWSDVKLNIFSIKFEYEITEFRIQIRP